MIKFESVSFSYNKTPVINNLSFCIETGRNLLITGPSGCGKTTVARLILGLNKCNSGRITAPDSIAAVFQEDRLVSNLSIYKNVALAVGADSAGIVDSLFEEFDLTGIMKKYPGGLSGGMKRRVAIMRAIAFGGDTIILDEPFNGIDDRNIRLITGIINREYSEKGKTVIIISHNKSDAAYFGADILDMTESKS